MSRVPNRFRTEDYTDDDCLHDEAPALADVVEDQRRPAFPASGDPWSVVLLAGQTTNQGAASAYPAPF